MAEARGYRLRFMVALVPDPVGSYIGSQFDTYATALLRGATASGWLPDRHWFPWRSDSAESPGKEPRQPSDSRYARSPGIVLFRSNSSDRILLTVFLVGESPITGIHKRAFVDALRLISSLQPTEELQVLGPFSSGAAGSCSLALEEWYTRTDVPRTNAVRFFSGSATNPEVAERLKPRCDVCGSLKVTFRRTVVSDDLLRQAAFQFFEKKLGWHHEEIAVLAESDTFYGQTSSEGPRHWRLLLPVPSALSSVRTASERRRKAEEVEIGGIRVPTYGLELKLDETRATRDTFPVFDPMTAPLNELELDSLLSILAKEKIRHLGLVFTDIRDRLFIAEKIKEFAPHVSIFTFESSVLYVHPRVNPYTDGMLVVSSYPLSMITQHLMAGVKGSLDRRVQFGSDPEQGLYNATIIALAGRGRTPPVADYVTVSETTYRAPAVWISAVGDGRLVPLALVRPGKPDLPQSLGTDEPDHPGSPARKSTLPPELRSLIRRLGVPSGFRFCLWVASIVFGLLSLSVVSAFSNRETRRSWRISSFFRPLMGRGRAERRQHRRWIAALIATFSASWMTMATVYLVPFVLRQRSGLAGEISIDLEHGDWISALEELLMRPAARLLPLFGVLLVVLLARLGWIVDRSDERRRRPILAVILGSTMVAALILSHQALSVFRPDPYGPLDQAVFTYLRASSGAGNLSPLVGILLLATGFELLLVFQLHRLRIRDDWRCRMPVEAFAQSQDLPLRSLERPQDQLDERIREALPRSVWFWAPFLVLLGPLLLAFFFRFEASCDSLLWSKTFAALFAFLLLPASVAAFSRFASLWRALRRLIIRHEWSRLLPAFQSCQEELEWHSLKMWGASRKHNYSTLVGSVELLRRVSGRAERPRVTLALTELLGREQLHLMDLARTAEEALTEALAANARGDLETERASRQRVLVALDAAAQHVQLMLNRIEAPGAEAADPEFRKELTEYLALRAIAYIRYVFAVIRNSLLAFTVGILFLLAGLASFHFQPIRSVYVLLWSVIGVVAIWTVVIFIEMDRNTVMSKISGTNPGEVNPIKSGLLLRIGAFVVPPVVALIVTQFPSLGQPLLSWLNPLFRLFQ